MRPAIVIAALAVVACTQASGSAPSRQVLADLPLDSLVKSLGPQFAAKGISVAGGQNHDLVGGLFEDTYTVEFAAQPGDVPTLALFSSRLRDVVSRRARVMGGGSSDGTYQSIMFVADSTTGWVHVVPAKPSSADFDRFVVVVTETRQKGNR